jgi:hypothetical protein
MRFGEIAARAKEQCAGGVSQIHARSATARAAVPDGTQRSAMR